MALLFSCSLVEFLSETDPTGKGIKYCHNNAFGLHTVARQFRQHRVMAETVRCIEKSLHCVVEVAILTLTG